MSEDPKPELETETAPETAPEPISEPATAVVTRAEIILDNLAAQQQRILDDQAALADQLRAVIDSQRLLGHDLTMTLALAQTLANGQTAVLDEMRAIRGQLARARVMVRSWPRRRWLSMTARSGRRGRPDRRGFAAAARRDCRE